MTVVIERSSKLLWRSLTGLDTVQAADQAAVRMNRYRIYSLAVPGMLSIRPPPPVLRPEGLRRA